MAKTDIRRRHHPLFLVETGVPLPEVALPVALHPPRDAPRGEQPVESSSAPSSHEVAVPFQVRPLRGRQEGLQQLVRPPVGTASEDLLFETTVDLPARELDDPRGAVIRELVPVDLVGSQGTDSELVGHLELAS